MANFEIQECAMSDAIIKVVGVGGCGGNAVAHMVERRVSGVEFLAMNTDSQALRRSGANQQLQLGEILTKGLGAGANPEVGRQAALADRERIAEMISGADMLFIAAGMGGGTGTGAAPIVAEIAREQGILTVAVVTKPFDFEGRRMKAALEGIEQLSQSVDSLIIIPNEKLLQVLGNEVSMLQAYEAANDVLRGAVAGIAEVINCPGMVNVDFADVRTVMSEMGVAMMGSAQAAGIDRATLAAQQAIASPLLEDVNLTGARGVLVNITASANLKLKEVHDVMNTIRSFTAEEATVIFGSVIDDAMADELRVTIVATGLGGVSKRAQQPFKVIRTGTHDLPMTAAPEGGDDYSAVIRSGRAQSTAGVVESMRQNGMGDLDIPAFLRRQAD